MDLFSQNNTLGYHKLEEMTVVLLNHNLVKFKEGKQKLWMHILKLVKPNIISKRI